ncbi:MAG: hypothetical protein J7L15_00960 [Clostridiales bacterium]|nr:hypothetical protein [Clostridiales bacterium]
MGAINTNFNVSCDFNAENCLIGEFELGEDEKYLTISIENGKNEKKVDIDLNKADVIMLRKWIEATLVLMEE